jgi:hypothetical protein
MVAIIDQMRLSFQMTVAAVRMTARYPASLLVALGNLVFLTIVAVGPISWMIWLASKDTKQAYEVLKYVFQFWFVDNAIETGDINNIVGSFMLWVLLVYFVWVTIVTFASLVTATVIMHTGVQQLKGQKPNLGDGFRLVGQNIGRLAGLAVVAGVLLTLARRFAGFLRAIPFVGRFMQRAIVVAITGALYVTLPIVVYERRGPWSAFKSSWENIRKTWGGLVVGTGLMVSALWMGLWFVWYMVRAAAESMTGLELIDWSTILILQFIGAVLLYCINVALSANLRAALYLHVTEGHTGVIPEAAFAQRPTPPAAPTAFYQVNSRP